MRDLVEERRAAPFSHQDNLFVHSAPPQSLQAAQARKLGRSLVKGVAFRTVLLSLETLHGPAHTNQVLLQLSEEARHALRYGTLVSGGWYPVEWYASLLQAVSRVGNGGVEVVRQVAVLSVEHDLKGVYRFFVEHLHPATIVSLYAKLFPRYYTTGRITVECEGNNQFTLRIEQCSGFTSLMWHEIYASGRHLLTLSGAKNIRHCLKDGGRDGDAHMVVDARWD